MRRCWWPSRQRLVRAILFAAAADRSHSRAAGMPRAARGPRAQRCFRRALIHRGAARQGDRCPFRARCSGQRHVRLVAAQSAAIVGVGLATGLAASFWLTSALRTFLFGVTPHDFASFAIVPGLLLIVALAASIVPALCAARVDPVKVLRA